MYFKSVLIWIVMALLAVLNGAFRVYIILPFTSEAVAHIISTVIFLVVQFLTIYLFIKKIKLQHVISAVKIGLLWVCMTVLFEFIFGHYVMNHPGEKLIADYNIFNGRLWLLVLLNNIAAPVFSFKINKTK